MAHHRPWYKRSGGALLMATLGFPDAETKWAYSAIIDMLNDRDRPLTDDAGFICGFTGLSRKKWSIVRKYLLETPSSSGEPFLILTERGDLTNPRFERERAERLRTHEEAREFGREGGRKSAAMRAAGQTELDLSGEEGHESTPDSRGESTPDSTPDRREKPRPAPSNSNNLAQPPPQATRARQSLDIREEDIQPTEPESLTPPGLPHKDLTALLAAVGDACGFHPSPAYPDTFAREIDFVKGWRDDGIDFDMIVIPTIRSMIATTTDPTSSLRRFDRRVRLEHAKAGAAPKVGSRAYRAPAEPILDREDEAPIIAKLRRDLLDRLGPKDFTDYVNPVRFEPVEDAGAGRKPLRIIDKRTHGRLDDSNRHTVVRAVAKRHGFTEVW